MATAKANCEGLDIARKLARRSGNVVSITMASVTTGPTPNPVCLGECSQGTDCCKNAALQNQHTVTGRNPVNPRNYSRIAEIIPPAGLGSLPTLGPSSSCA